MSSAFQSLKDASPQLLRGGGDASGLEGVGRTGEMISWLSKFRRLDPFPKGVQGTGFTERAGSFQHAVSTLLVWVKGPVNGASASFPV